MAVYMTVILIGRYQANKSTTSIAYKQYADTDEDLYPTFSICLNGNGLYKYNGTAVSDAYGLNPRNYDKMLHGQPAFRYEYDPTSRLYRKTPHPLGQKTHFAFENIVQNSHEIYELIKKAYFEAEMTNLSVSYEKKPLLDGKVTENLPFYIPFQTPNMRCLTREWKQNPSLTRVKDQIHLDTSFLELTADVEFFIHYPGQLIRSFDSPIFKSDSDDILNENLQFKVSQSTVWRQRSIDDKPCLKDIGNYDEYFQQAVSEKMGCVPPFWMNTISLTSILKECTSSGKLKEANELIRDYKRILDEIHTPCIDMFNSVVWNKLKTGQHAFIEIIYADKFYEEISQAKDFGVQDFVSNLGGFIGIFLGYSMMQIPELLGTFKNTLENFLGNMLNS